MDPLASRQDGQPDSSADAGLDGQVFGTLFHHYSEAVFAVRRDTGTVVTANSRLEELTGRALSSIVGAPIADILAAPDDPRGEADDNEGDLADGIVGRPGLHEDVPIRRMDGYPVFVSLTVAHVNHGGVPLAACVARDTTERRLLERELISKHMALYAAHDDLEGAVRDLAERNRELSMMGARLSLETRRALIGELSAGIAHSLNNPLGALVSAQRQIQLAVDEAGSVELRDRVGRYLKRGRDAIQRMEEIVKAVRHAHKSGATASDPRLLDLSRELDVALSLFEPRLGRVRVARPDAALGHAWVPPSDLQHILWNLIDNAILAMPEGGELSFTARRDGDAVVLAVRDAGSGVPEALRPTLFEPFNSTRATGTGLGLSTSRRLARQAGGDVRLVPSSRGACFEIVLPGREPPCPPPQAPPDDIAS